MIICGMHEDFMKIEELGLEPRIVCCEGKFEFKSVMHAILIKDMLHKYFLN